MADEKFTGDSEFEVQKIICNDCIHFKGYLKCKAFPGRIPDIILNGINNHNMDCQLFPYHNSF